MMAAGNGWRDGVEVRIAAGTEGRPNGRGVPMAIIEMAARTVDEACPRGRFPEKISKDRAPGEPLSVVVVLGPGPRQAQVIYDRSRPAGAQVVACAEAMVREWRGGR